MKIIKKIHTHTTLHGVLSCYYYYYYGCGGPTHQCLWFIVHSCDVSMCSTHTHTHISKVCVCIGTRLTANQLLVACPENNAFATAADLPPLRLYTYIAAACL